MKGLKIPRWYGNDHCTEECQLLGDASELSYGVAVYLRVIQKSGQMIVTLIYAKTRVAPLKTISIPRLELCAANLLVNAIIHVKSSLKIPIAKIWCFSDSKVVLAWLSKHSLDCANFCCQSCFFDLDIIT